MKSYFFAFIFLLTGSTSIAGNINKSNTESNYINVFKNYQATNLFGINPLDTVYFDLSDAVFSGVYIYVPIYIEAYDTINSFDFSLKYNHTDLKYDSVIVNVPYLSGVSFSENPLDSTVRFTSYSPTVLYKNYVPIVYVRFKIKSNYVNNSDIYSLNAYLNGDNVGTHLIKGVMWLAPSTHNPSCQNIYDGSINISVYGGNPPFSYTWSSGDTTSNLQYISAGIYYVTITDHSGYVKTDSVTLTNPSLLFNLVNPTCSTLSDGSITLSDIGGTAPYNYIWSNGVTTKDIHFRAAGTYSVTVSDYTGCILNGNQILVDSLALSISNSLNAPSCIGSNNGNIAINVSGGEIPYTYLWSNSATSNVIDSLSSGNYVVTVTDNKGCKHTESINLPDPPAIMTLTNSINLSCTSINDGEIKLFISGGSPPYNYLWSNAETSQNIDSLALGSYFVTITDTKGCVAIDSAIVDNSSELLLNFNKSDVSCYDISNGYIQLNTINGIPPYAYSWSTGDTTQSIYNLSPGIYTVTVSQTNKCKKIDSVKIYSPTKIDIALQKTDPCCSSSSNGFVQAFAQGGYPPYLYKWSNSGSNDTISNLKKGSYTITVTDANNCTSLASVDLEPIGINCIEIYSGFTPNGDGNNDVWNIKGIESYPDCTVNIFNQWGENIFSSKGYDKPWDGTHKGKGLPSAVYYYFIDLGNGDKYSGSVFLLK